MSQHHKWKEFYNKAFRWNELLFGKGKSLTKTLKATKHDCLDPGTRPKEKAACHFIHYEPVSPNEPKQHSVNHNTKENTQPQY